MSTPDDSSAFTQVWERDGPRLAAYVRRHVAAADVPDVVAETFLQAWPWRRWPGSPTGSARHCSWSPRGSSA